MNYRGQLLPLLTADFYLSAMPKNGCDFTVQEHRRKFCRVARHHPRIYRRRGTANLDDGMLKNAKGLRFRERGVGHLVHADSARSKLVDRKRIRSQTPPPIGARNGIAGALYL